MSTQLHLKAHSRGSWTNVCSFTPGQIHDVKEAAWVLCAAADRSVSFKIADDTGVTLHSLDARQAPQVWQDRSA